MTLQIIDGKKRCLTCKKLLILKSNFYMTNLAIQSATVKPVFMTSCKKCTGKNTKKYSKANPLRRKAIIIKNKYGLSWDNYLLLFSFQDNKCAICPNSVTKEVSVDHDHKLKKGVKGFVRGLLCKTCNWGLGSFKDSPDLLRKAAEYLEELRD